MLHSCVAQTVDLLVEPRLPPRLALAQERYLLDDAPRAGRATLRVAEVAGDVLSIGRYHLAPSPPAGGPVAVARRHSGGRAVAAGDGFLQVTLVLPHRSALVAPGEPLALTPTQVMNRYVRGILEACRLAGVSAFYPGLDWITVAGRRLGLVSFEVNAAGALLFEAVVANAADASQLAARLDAADPTGAVRATMLMPSETTSLARERGAPLALDEAAATLARGYAARLGVEAAPRTLAAAETAAVAALAEADAAWLAARRPRPDLDRRPWSSTPLGVLETHFALAPEGTIREACLTGDFIANSPAVDALERGLRGCPGTRAAVAAVIGRVLAAPESFVLGVGPVETIAATFAKALPA